MVVEEKRIIPPVCPLAIFTLAILYGDFFFVKNRGFSVAVIVVSLIFFSICSTLFSVVPSNHPRWSRLIFCLCASAGIIMGSICAVSLKLQQDPIASLADKTRITAIHACFLSDPTLFGTDMYRVTARVFSCEYANGSFFSARGVCSLIIPAGMKKANVPGGISNGGDREILYSSGLTANFTGRFALYSSVRGDSFYVTGIDGSNLRWNTRIDTYRAGLRLSLARILYDWGEAGGFLLALFSANKDYLDPNLADEFRRTGLSHILALSGMHLSLMGFIAAAVGKKIGGKRFSVWLSLCALVFFVWFAGASPSLNRALLMALFVVLFRRLGFDVQPIPVLALTAFIQTTLNPSNVISLAFVLSYGALWGILTFGGYIASITPPEVPSFMARDLAASIGAQLMTAPIVAAVIGVIAPIGIVASCIVGPLSSFFLAVGIFLIGITVMCPPLGHLCGSLTGIIYRLDAIVVHIFARIPPLPIRGAIATIAACIAPIAAGIFCMRLSARCLKRRSADDGFARL